MEIKFVAVNFWKSTQAQVKFGFCQATESEAAAFGKAAEIKYGDQVYSHVVPTIDVDLAQQIRAKYETQLKRAKYQHVKTITILEKEYKLVQIEAALAL